MPFKPRADQPRAPLATKENKLGQANQEEMEQEEGIHLTHIAKELANLKLTAGTDLMYSVKFINRWAMLRRFVKTKAIRSKTNLNSLE